MTEANRYRGRSLPSPVIPTSSICYVIEIPDALEYRAAFFGQLAELGNWWAWEHPTDGTECIDCEEAAQLWRTAAFEGYFMPKNGCGCGSGAPSVTDYMSSITYVNETNLIYNNTYNTWNDAGQTVYSIAPNLDFDTGDPVNVSKLVCAAVEMLVKSILAQAKQIKIQTQAQNENMTNQIAAAMAGLATAGGIASTIGGVGAGAVALFGGPWMLLGLALGAVGLHIYGAIAAADTSLFDNKVAIDHVICAIQKNLNNKQVTRAAFAAALTPLGYSSGSAEGQLAAIIQPFFDDLNTYLQLMVFGNQLYGQVTFSEMPECGCEEDLCSDMLTGTHEWVVLDPVYGNYIGGEGWARGTDSSRLGLMKDFAEVVVKITVTTNEPLTGIAFGQFAGYMDFGSESIGGTAIAPNIYQAVGSWDHGVAWELIGGPIPSTLRVVEVCVEFAP